MGVNSPPSVAEMGTRPSLLTPTRRGALPIHGGSGRSQIPPRDTSARTVAPMAIFPRLRLPGSSKPALHYPDLRNIADTGLDGRPVVGERDYDDLMVHRTWREYEQDSPGHVRYFMYHLSQRNPGDTVYAPFYKAVRMIRLTRVPRYLRQATVNGNGSGAAFEQQRDVLAALREQDIMFINLIAKSNRLPLVFSYGVQAVGATALEAQQAADEAYAVLKGQLDGTYQQLMYAPLTVEEGEILARHQVEWNNIAIARGRPVPTGGSMGNAGLLDGNRTDVENMNNQLESFIRGMSDKNFLLTLVTVPLAPADITLAWRNITQKLSDVRSDQSGTRSVSAGVSLPLMMGTSVGDGHTASHGLTSTEGVGSSDSYAKGVTDSTSDALSTTTTDGTNSGTSLTDTTGIAQAVSQSQAHGTSSGTSASGADSITSGVNASQGTSSGSSQTDTAGTNATNTEGVNASQTEGTSRTDTTGTSQTNTEGTSRTDTEGTSRTDTTGTSRTDTEGTSRTDTTGTSRTDTQGTSRTDTEGTSRTNTEGTSRTDTEGSSRTRTEGSSDTRTEGTSRTRTEGSSDTTTRGTNESSTTGRNHSIANQDGHSQTEGTNRGGSSSRGSGTNTGWSTGSGSSHGGNQGISGGVPGFSGNEGNNWGNNNSDGVSGGSSTNNSQGTNWGNSESSTDSSSRTNSRGTSNSETEGSSRSNAHGTSESNARGTSRSDAHSVSESVARGTSESVARGTSESVARGTSESTARGTSQSTAVGTSQSTASGTSQSTAVGTSQSTAAGTSQSTAMGTSQSTAMGTSQSTAAGVSSAATSGTSASTALGTSQATAMGVNQGVNASTGTSDSSGHTNTQGTNQGVNATSTGGTSSTDSSSRANGATQGVSNSQSSGATNTAGRSVSDTNTAGTSTNQSLSDAYQVALARTAGQSASLAVAPNFGVTMSKQTFDEGKRVLGDLLEAQQRRYIEGIESGAFLYQMFLTTPDRETLVAGSGLLKAAFWGAGGPDKRLPQPFHTMDTFGDTTDTHTEEAGRLLTHAGVFSSYRKREPQTGLVEPFLYSTYVTPGEAATFCHPPTTESSGLLAVQDSMPVLSMPADRQDKQMYLGHVFNGERAVCSNVKYGFDPRELVHLLLTGVTGSGKTTSLMRLLLGLTDAETPYAATVGEGVFAQQTTRQSKASVLALDWMSNMRDLAGVVPADRFRFYHLLKPQLGKFTWNLLAVPAEGMSTQEWLNSQADNFTASFALGDFGRSLIAELLTDLYSANRLVDTELVPAVTDDNGVVLRAAYVLPAIDPSRLDMSRARLDANGAQTLSAMDDPSLSRCVGIQHLAALVVAKMEEHGTQEAGRAAGTAIRDRLQSLWRRLQYFAPGGQFENMLSFDPDPLTHHCLGVTDLVDPDRGLVTVVETDGLDLHARRLILGSVLMAVYRYGLFHGDGTFDHQGQGPGVWVVLEEAHELFGESARDEDAASVATRNALYESMFRRCRALGMHLIAVAQNPSSLPEAVTSNISTVVVHQLMAQDDRLRIASLLNWDKAPIGGNLREIRWLGELPRGHCVVRTPPMVSWLEAAPTNIVADPAGLRRITDQQLSDHATRQEHMVRQRG